MLMTSIGLSFSTYQIDTPLPFSDAIFADYDRLVGNNVRHGEVLYAGFRGLEMAITIDRIARVDPASLDTAEKKLAFYVNAYNALVISSVNAGGDPSTWWGRLSVFLLPRHNVAGTRSNLYDLENVVIRSLGEPLIHFALVCASRSCPILRARAYRTDTVLVTMRENAVRFLDDTRKNQVLPGTGPIRLSPIFDWYRDDFDSIHGFVNELGFKIPLEADITFTDYDWRLNGVR